MAAFSGYLVKAKPGLGSVLRWRLADRPNFQAIPSDAVFCSERPLSGQSGHKLIQRTCPLWGVKRT